MSVPVVSLMFLRSYDPKGKPADLVDELRHQLATIPGCELAELEASGLYCVKAVIPAGNARQAEALREVVENSISGWSLIEENSYGVPTTF